MPEGLKDLAQDIREDWDYQEAMEQVKLDQVQRRKQKELVPFTSLECDMEGASCCVVQANSTDNDWETKAVMGAQPGIYYGAHCSGVLESVPSYVQWSEQYETR